MKWAKHDAYMAFNWKIVVVIIYFSYIFSSMNNIVCVNSASALVL